MSGTWSSRVVGELARLKAEGWSFDEAWRAAMQEHPPRGRDRGPAARALFGSEAGESHAEFLRRVCEDAWHDRKPLLGRLGDMHGLIFRDGTVAGRTPDFRAA